jgi:hypothetical protein
MGEVLTMKAEPSAHHKYDHMEELRRQLARSLERELVLMAEDREERARQLGFDALIPESRKSAIAPANTA